MDRVFFGKNMNKSHDLVIIFGDHVLMFNYKSRTSYAKLVMFVISMLKMLMLIMLMIL